MKRDMKNAILGGVCAGLGNYMGIDPIFIRLLFIFAVLMYGFGILPYLLLWLIVPKEE